MDSASQSDIPPEEPPSRWSHVVGFFIAVLTLTLPIVAIAHFSSARISPAEVIPYTLPGPRD